ncbi:type II secretion system F family protein [Anaerobacillus alkaliphilus]|uniref:Type II secretion system F family protein n=1 Tax=Anaerobacillus alkaliphilus TaxID=1548597 RepID=A0A4V1LG38_9BACI|nr:type II secretion system F family protein [Anaerobacillus alkaliphilus]RXI98414.1 type II secretion system F family protein [Anaerobacillus alkaliphilus]
MAQFQFEGRTRSGKKQTGMINGNTKRDVIAKLRERGVAVTQISEVKESVFRKDIVIGNPVKYQDFVIYLRQFSTLLKAGVTLVDATNILSKQTESKYLRKALAEVEEDIRAGNPFSDSAAKHKKIFPPMFINMMRAGEASGTIDEALERLADHFEKQYQTRQKVFSAMAYPTVIGFIAIFVVIFLLTTVVPTFANMLLSFGGELPAITVFVLSASEFVQSSWWLFIILAIGLYVAFLVVKSKPTSKYYLDFAILRLPIFGKMLQKAALARMARTLSSLFSSSVPILQAIAIVEKVVENEVIARTLQKSRRSLEAGLPLTEPMRDHWVFPPLVVQMIAIGEETGSLDQMLSKVADFYETEVENATDRLKSLIEPLMIVFLAAIVGTIVIAIMVPMFQIYSEI